MKFTPLEDIKHDGRTYEAGNTYDAEKNGVDADDVRRFHAAGWAEVEGMGQPGERKVINARIDVQGSNHAHTAEEV